MNPAPLLALLTLLLLGATPPNLAVLELADRAGLRPAEADYLTDLVRTTAGRRPGLRVLTREDIIERLPPGTDLAACEADCEIEIGRRLGADFVISGEIIDFAGELRVLLRLHATRTATLLAGERAGALRLADLETPIESATARLLDRTGVAGPDPANATAPNPLEAPIAPRLAPITFARVVPRAGPHIPPALFLTRAEPLAAEDHHAADAALVAQIRTAPQPDRTALTLRRGLLARDAAAAITLRAYFAEDTCLARAPVAAARARCAADRAARTREAEAAHRLVIATLAPLVDPANAAITAHADHADHDDRADRANRTDPAGHSNPANRNNIADRNNTADHSNPVDYNNPADPAARPHRTAPAAPLAQADTALLALADAHRALADHAAARRATASRTGRSPCPRGAARPGAFRPRCLQLRHRRGSERVVDHRPWHGRDRQIAPPFGAAEQHGPPDSDGRPRAPAALAGQAGPQREDVAHRARRAGGPRRRRARRRAQADEKDDRLGSRVDRHR